MGAIPWGIVTLITLFVAYVYKGVFNSTLFLFYKRINMIYIIGVLWLLYSGFWFYILNDAIKNDLENVEKDYGEKLPESYLKNYLICNFVVAIIAPVVHLWQVFLWCVSKCYLLLKTVVFGAIDLICNVVKCFKGKK